MYVVIWSDYLLKFSDNSSINANNIFVVSPPFSIPCDIHQPHLILGCPGSHVVVGALQEEYVAQGEDGGRVPRT